MTRHVIDSDRRTYQRLPTDELRTIRQRLMAALTGAPPVNARQCRQRVLAIDAILREREVPS